MPRTKKKLADWAKNGEQADAFSTEIADEDLEALIETAIDLEDGATKRAAGEVKIGEGVNFALRFEAL